MKPTVLLAGSIGMGVLGFVVVSTPAAPVYIAAGLVLLWMGLASV